MITWGKIYWNKTYRNTLTALVLSFVTFSSFIRYPACVWAGTEIPDMSHYRHITNFIPYIQHIKYVDPYDKTVFRYVDFQFSTPEGYRCGIGTGEEGNRFTEVECEGIVLPGVNRYYNQVKLSPMFAASFRYDSKLATDPELVQLSHHESVKEYPFLPANSMFVYPHPMRDNVSDNPLTCGYSDHHSLTCYGYYDSDVKGGLLSIRTLIGFTISPQGTHIFEYPTPDLSVAGSTDRI